MSLLGIIFVMLLSFLSGVMLIYVGISGFLTGEYGVEQLLFGVICGLILSGVPIVFAYLKIRKKRTDESTKSSNYDYDFDSDISDDLKYIARDFKENILMIYKIQPDVDETDRLLSKFREDYERSITHGNIRSTVTQVFLRTLSLHSKRLSKKGISIISRSKRQRYSSLPSVQKNVDSRGQFIITDISEDIKSVRLYKNDEGKKIYKKKDSDIAHYTILAAKNAGEGVIICPNCGAQSTRENLLDGCDYCNTKFTINDLSDRVADYSLRNDYYTHYAKYNGRVGRTANILIISSISLVVLFFIAVAVSIFSEISKENGVVPALIASFFSLSLIGFFVWFFTKIFVWPAQMILKFIAAVNYKIKTYLSGLRKKIKVENEFERVIKKEDPLFSLPVFYNSIQNKTASFIFADEATEINAFAAVGSDFTNFLNYNKDIIDFNVHQIHMTDYHASDGYRNAKVEISLSILKYDGKKVKSLERVLVVDTVKSLLCKTPQIYAPSVMKCKNCGASLSLNEGKNCEFCGQSFDYADYDWAIKDIHYNKKRV